MYILCIYVPRPLFNGFVLASYKQFHFGSLSYMFYVQVALRYAHVGSGCVESTHTSLCSYRPALLIQGEWRRQNCFNSVLEVTLREPRLTVARFDFVFSVYCRAVRIRPRLYQQISLCLADFALLQFLHCRVPLWEFIERFTFVVRYKSLLVLNYS